MKAHPRQHISDKYNTRIGVTSPVHIEIQYTFIFSNFSYCPLTWHFSGEVNAKKIEKIQERAFRFIYSDYNCSYESLLVKSQLPSLKVRRLRSIALESFKRFE